MKFTAKQYAQALFEALSETDSKSHDKVLENFASILASQGDLGKYTEIANEFELLDLKKAGFSQAKIKTATEIKIDQGLLDGLNKVAQTKLKIEQSTDPSLVGGMVMKVDETFMDISIKTQLNNLNESLKQ